MDLTNVTNLNVRQLDWAADERRAALAKVPAMRSQRKGAKVAGVAASSVWMSDLSGSDRRSVKAWLAGRGDARVALWRAKQVMARLVGATQKVESEEIRNVKATRGGFAAFGQMMAKAWAMLAPAAVAGNTAR